MFIQDNIELFKYATNSATFSILSIDKIDKHYYNNYDNNIWRWKNAKKQF